jgi:hypothetical protein
MEVEQTFLVIGWTEKVDHLIKRPIIFERGLIGRFK